MLTNVTPEEAAALVMTQPCPLSREEAPLDEALDRVLAEDVSARLTLPPFNKSPFDGYACRSGDTPGILRVIGTLSAGIDRIREIGPGQAVKIFTGAPVPDSADAVVKLEDVEIDGDRIRVSRPAAPGTNVICRGEDVRQGARLLPAGTRLQPAHLGLLAGQGIASVPVFRRPRAVLIPTGTELRDPGEDCDGFQIYNSSSFALCAYLRRMGFSAVRRPIVPDEPGAVRAAVEKALAADNDVVFTTGGASAGDYDFAKKTAESLGAEILFWKVRMKPGGALLVSRLGSRLLVSLSGNPAAALMSLLVVLRPWLTALTGSEDRSQILTLPMKEDMPKTGGTLRLLRGHLEFAEGRVCFAEHEGRGNGNLASFGDCELIGMIPGGFGPLKKGDWIRALRLPPELS